jgi:hypothetical protein
MICRFARDCSVRFLVACVLSPSLILMAQAQPASVSFAGSTVQLGLAKDAVLQRLAINSLVQVRQLQPDQPDLYRVMVKQLDGSWESAGDLQFRSGKLTYLVMIGIGSNDKAVAAFAKAAYTAVSTAEPHGIKDVWTGWNGDANTPMYQIHLVYKDREVVIGVATLGNTDISDVRTIFRLEPTK